MQKWVEAQAAMMQSVPTSWDRPIESSRCLDGRQGRNVWLVVRMRLALVQGRSLRPSHRGVADRKGGFFRSTGRLTEDREQWWACILLWLYR